MRRSLIIATTAAGTVLATGLLAGPALAQGRGPGDGLSDPTTTCTTGTGPQAGDAAGYGRRNGAGDGSGLDTRGGGAGLDTRGGGAGRGTRGGGGQTAADPLAGLVQGTLTAEQKTALADMAEEEKLAHDVYVALYSINGDLRFSRIADSEARHLAEVRALLTRYGIADPTTGKADGVFSSPAVQKLYDDLVARGDDSLEAALGVGRDIENLDIADLAKAGAGVTAPDVQTVYSRLSNGSEKHLRAFGG